MSRSYRKQPVWKDHNNGMKAIANRKVRRALNRDHGLELKNKLYKRHFCSWNICDYCSLVDKSFERFYREKIRGWTNKRYRFCFRDDPCPSREEIYRQWLQCRRK